MDNVTHTLVGVALARAGFRRVTPHATLLLILASNLPDIDILSLAGGQLADLEIHRGYTHTLLAVPLLALLCVAITAVIGSEKLVVWKAWLVACLGVSCHLLLDWTNSFGIRPFLPFSSRWYYLDLNGLYDSVIIGLLAMMLVWPWFVRLIGTEIGRRDRSSSGQGTAITVLFFLLLFEGGRWMLHRHAVDRLSSRLYDGEVPISVAALPEPNSPLRWKGIVETETAFRVVTTGALDLSDASDMRVFLKPHRNASYSELLSSEPFRYMAYFSRFPAWRIEPATLGRGVGEKVETTDLRFGSPGDGVFQAMAIIDSSGSVLKSGFSFWTEPDATIADK